jgi:hypothetical protein
MNVELRTEAAQFPEKDFEWDFRCTVVAIIDDGPIFYNAIVWIH